MRRSPCRICIPIMAQGPDEALGKMEKAGPLADLLELRLDAMERVGDLRGLLKAAPRPVLVTYRSREEGGRGTAGPEGHGARCMEALRAGALFLDVEMRLPGEVRQEVLARKGETSVVLSRHVPEGTPSRRELARLLDEAAGAGGDILKIVTLARSSEDNLRVLELIPRARALGQEIIAFCMGPEGRISRVFSCLLGAFLTFAALEGGEESAPGQLTVGELKGMLGRFSG